MHLDLRALKARSASEQTCPKQRLHLSSSDVSTTDFIDTCKAIEMVFATDVGVGFRPLAYTHDTNSDTCCTNLHKKLQGSPGSFDLNFTTRNLQSFKYTAYY